MPLPLSAITELGHGLSRPERVLTHTSGDRARCFVSPVFDLAPVRRNFDIAALQAAHPNGV